MVSPQIDTTFIQLAIEYLETRNSELLPKIALTPAAHFLADHAARVSLSGNGPTAEELVEQLLKSHSMTGINPENIRDRLLLIQTDTDTQLRCWNEAADYLPIDALSGTVLYLTVGYDIGVAMNGCASLNLANHKFAANPEEFRFYCVHELHHVGFQKYNPMPALADIQTTSDLANLIRYSTAMEGLAVHAARKWRTEVGILETDSDYVALLNSEHMILYEKEFFRLYSSLAEAKPRSLVKDDWNILEPMSTGDRLWYRVGALMANQIERELGRNVLTETIVQGPEAFFRQYSRCSSHPLGT